jgi:hypothetical protein
MSQIVQPQPRVFGYPGTRPGKGAAFPKVRLVLLVETGTHLIIPEPSPKNKTISVAA